MAVQEAVGWSTCDTSSV